MENYHIKRWFRELCGLTGERCSKDDNCQNCSISRFHEKAKGMPGYITPKDLKIELMKAEVHLIDDGEKPNCEHFIDFGRDSNICVGNEPYRCSRAKKEGLCHKANTGGSD